MAEPAGIFIETKIEEKAVKQLLNQSFNKGKLGKKLGYYFSELLYKCNTEGNVFIFHYDKVVQKCFIGWMLNHFHESDIEPFIEVLQIISRLKVTDTTDYAVVASTCDIYDVFAIAPEKVQKIPTAEYPAETVNDIIHTFWSFSQNNSFPDPEKALKKRNYLYKNFKNYYRKYLIFVEEIEKPRKIAEATKEKPYLLFGCNHYCFYPIYTYDNKVFEFRYYTNQVIELPKADPFTFREEAGILADKNFVFISRLASDSPPESIKNEWGSIINNPKAIWEYYIVEGIDGASFKYLGYKWEPVYFTDKNSVFYQLKKIDKADSATFEYLGFCYGKDKNFVFYGDTIIPINPNNFKLDKHGFIYDNKNIFHYEKKIPLDAETFKVEEYESEVNPFTGVFILSDKNGKFEYNSRIECRDVDITLRPIS